MTKKTVLFFMLLVFPLLLLYLVIEFSSYESNPPTAQQGVLDLSGWNFEENGAVPLDGEWEFYGNQLLTYQDFHNGTGLQKTYAALPGTWNYYGDNLPVSRYATYRLKIKTTNPDSIKGLTAKTGFTSYTLMVNDLVVAGNRIAGKNTESYFSGSKPPIRFFKTDQNEFEIILQAADFVYGRGGPGYSIYLGTDRQIMALWGKNQQKGSFLLGAIFIMALYHTAIYLLQRKNHDKAGLYFVFFIVLCFIDIALRGRYAILNGFLSPSIHWLVGVQYTAKYWISAAWAMFMQELYPKECSVRLTKLIVANSCFLTLLTFLTSIALYPKFTLYLQIQLLTVALYYAYIAWTAFIRNRAGAALLFSTLIFSIGAFILDSLYHWKIYSKNCEEVFPLVSLIFIFVQAFILAQRFSAAFSDVNSLSQKLLSLDKVKDHFITAISHELRTPLHGMITITESVLECTAGVLSRQPKETLNLVVSGGKRLTTLVSNILDYERLKSGNIHLNQQSMNIQEVSYTSPPRTMLFKTPAVFRQSGDFTVLLVDDDYGNLQALINILAAENYSAIAVANGNEALEVLKQNKDIDLVILDSMLPYMSGYEVCRKIRETYSPLELPVLMMTAQHSADSMLSGFAAGSNDFLNKPFHSSELKARMKTLLQLKKSVCQTLQAEMAFLQAQIKPHFLYNALNTIMSFCWTDAEKAGQLLLALSSYLRSSFNFNTMSQFSTLEKELEFVGFYLTIEKARFEEKLNVQYDIAVSLQTIIIPNLIIQPIVENAIKHGILPKKEGGTIIISIKQEAPYILITIQDDGVGISQDTLSQLLTNSKKKGVGLANIDRRLKRLYGHGIQIISKANAGTTINIKIPAARKEP
ncbi:response regulator [Propionispora sp. 2/2-37]|uniref:response regulator n=1 Tax=Propionispora sp. 2/2-37 TaxID=1677858 RepID=UPI00155DB6B9|nr:response regulator [Propionispora sp. 2/2-37]